jgi:hypothetical protein
LKIAGQQGRYGVAHGDRFSSWDRVWLVRAYQAP